MQHRQAAVLLAVLVFVIGPQLASAGFTLPNYAGGQQPGPQSTAPRPPPRPQLKLPGQGSSSPPEVDVTESFIVLLKEDSATTVSSSAGAARSDAATISASARAVTQRLGSVMQVTQTYERVRGYSFRLSDTASRESVLAMLKADPSVAVVEENKVVWADEMFTASYTPSSSMDTFPSGVFRVHATATGPNEDVPLGAPIPGAASVTVAVIDTGCPVDHPDLAGVVVGRYKAPGIPGTPDAADDNGHGTHVIGTISALRDGKGVVGVAPGTRIFCAKVLGAGGSGATSDVIAGMDAVASKARTYNIRVASMSLGGSGRSSAMCEAARRLEEAGVLLVAAAGNSGTDLGNHYPANCPTAIAVTSLDDRNDGRFSQQDSPSSFSNWATAPEDVERTVTAPGSNVLSTHLAGRYRRLSGTSMATPHASAVLARCFGLSYTCEGIGGSFTAGGPCALIFKSLGADLQTAASIARSFYVDSTRESAFARPVDSCFASEPWTSKQGRVYSCTPFGEGRFYGYTVDARMYAANQAMNCGVADQELRRKRLRA